MDKGAAVLGKVLELRLGEVLSSLRTCRQACSPRRRWRRASAEMDGSAESMVCTPSEGVQLTTLKYNVM